PSKPRGVRAVAVICTRPTRAAITAPSGRTSTIGPSSRSTRPPPGWRRSSSVSARWLSGVASAAARNTPISGSMRTAAAPESGATKGDRRVVRALNTARSRGWLMPRRSRREDAATEARLATPRPKPAAQPRSISPEASTLPEADDLLDLGDGRLGHFARLFGAGGQRAVDLDRVGHQAAHLGGDIAHRRHGQLGQLGLEGAEALPRELGQHRLARRVGQGGVDGHQVLGLGPAFQAL